MIRRRALWPVLVVALTCALAAVPAAADPVAGATYTGTGSGGESITFTVSSDGTIVDAFTVNGTGADCRYTAGGDPVEWTGAPITAESFSYDDGDTFNLVGTFDSQGGASGTFHYDFAGTPNPDYPQSSQQQWLAPPCHSGTVHWTASTASHPPGGGSTGGGTSGTGGGSTGTGSGGTGGGTSGSKSPSTGKPKRRAIITRVTLRPPTRTALRGHLTSSNRSCRAGRTVILWQVTKRVATARTAADGSFSFARPKLWRGKHVRVSVTARTLRGGPVCAAGSSVYIHA